MKKENKKIHPEVDLQTAIVDAEYSIKRQLLFVCTQKDVRSYEIETGKCAKIISGITGEHEEINEFALSCSEDFMIISDTSGKLHWITIADGSESRKENSIGAYTGIFSDRESKQIMGCSVDVIYFQKFF